MRRAAVCDEYSGSESAAAATTKALRSSASYEMRPETSAKNDLEASAGARRTTHEPSRNLL